MLKIKKIIILLICVCIIFTFTAYAEEMIYTSTLVVLGDSIAAGTALANKTQERYSTIVGKQMGSEIFNKAVDGMTSEALILALNSGAYDEFLSKADYVSVSIGSNDLLQPFFKILQEVFFENAETAASLLNPSGIVNIFTNATQKEIMAMCNKLNSRLINNETLIKACEDYGAKLTTLTAIIRQKTPNSAEILINNIYNPYIGVKISFLENTYLDLQEITEFYVNYINKNFDKKAEFYTLVDLYTPFSKGGLTNAKFNLLNMTDISFDPHPNAAGHSVIASVILNIIDIMPHPVDISGHWAELYIKAMIHKGLFDKLVDDKFRPDDPMSRGTFVTILGKFLNADVSAFNGSAFDDVSVYSYYSPYVKWASSNGFVLGTGKNKFQPDDPILREDMAVILQRCIKSSKYKIASELPAAKDYRDAANIADYAAEAINLMGQLGLMFGDDKGDFNPKKTISNAEVVTILYRYDDKFLK